MKTPPAGWRRSILALALLAACAPKDSPAAVEPDLPAAQDVAADAKAVRFLTQATFGPTSESIRAVRQAGLAGWLDEQMAIPATVGVPALAELGCFAEQQGVDDCPDDGRLEEPHRERMELWWQHVLFGRDELRQRVAFALSEIFVVSERSDVLANFPLLLQDYYDTLARGAFGTYRDLLESVTLHPAMGLYLSMVKNPKPDPDLGIRPDENYAREVMQLFSIGLVLLNPDGSPLLDEDGDAIPTYDQDVIQGMAHAFTGWNFAGVDAPHLGAWIWAEPKIGDLEPWDEHHDQHPKRLVTGVETSGGESAEEDMALVLDLLAGHPNVGPFLGRRLIQRLVTSNPTPAYIARVSAVFDDDGAGVRGNLAAVVRAILLDPEARRGHLDLPETFGKVREPLLRLTALWRAFGVELQGERVEFPWIAYVFDQAPMSAPSVFNFFQPDFAPPGPVGDAGLVAPEMQITTHTFVTRVSTFLGYLAHAFFVGTDCEDCEELPLLDFAFEASLASNAGALVDHLDARLLGGTMSAEMRTALVDYLRGIPLTEDDPERPRGTTRVREAVNLVVASPEFAVQK